MRNEKVDRAVAIQIRGDDGGCRLGRKCVARGETAFTVVQAEKTRRWRLRALPTIRRYDIRISVAIQIGESHVPCTPSRAAKCAGFGKAAVSIVQVNELA